MRQKYDMTCQSYLQKFQNHIDVIEHCGGAIGEETDMIDHMLVVVYLTRVSANVTQMIDAARAARQQYISCAFILGADRN
jgi:hypothetical protein